MSDLFVGMAIGFVLGIPAGFGLALWVFQPAIARRRREISAKARERVEAELERHEMIDRGDVWVRRSKPEPRQEPDRRGPLGID